MAEAVVQARRDLAAEKLAEHIRQIVEAAPPLSMTQKQQLAALLSAEGPSPALPRRLTAVLRPVVPTAGGGPEQGCADGWLTCKAGTQRHLHQLATVPDREVECTSCWTKAARALAGGVVQSNNGRPGQASPTAGLVSCLTSRRPLRPERASPRGVPALSCPAGAQAAVPCAVDGRVR